MNGKRINYLCYMSKKIAPDRDRTGGLPSSSIGYAGFVRDYGICRSIKASYNTCILFDEHKLHNYKKKYLKKKAWREILA